MTIIPDWSSLESVSKIYNWAGILGIVFLALLVLAEVVAHVYGNRKDTLVEEATQRRVQEADRRLAEVQQQQAHRHLSDEQKQLLVKALSPFRGQKVLVACLRGDAEGKRFAEELASILQKTEWDFGKVRGTGVAQFDLVSRNPVGVRISVNKEEADAGRIPKAAQELTRALVRIGIKDEETIRGSLQVPVGEIEIVIGEKLPREKGVTND